MVLSYCKKCLYPSNHPLGLTFNAQGVCSGCEIHDEKDCMDWNRQEEKLKAILEANRCLDGQRHDCVVPVSGGKDSFFIVHTLKVKYGLNPLLVSFNRHYNTAAGLTNLELLRTKTGCDIVTQTLNPDVYKKLIRSSLKLRGSVHWPYLAGSTVFPVQVAIKRHIPLIVWGAHQGVHQVGMFSHYDQVEMSRRYRKEHDLMGLEPEDLPKLDPNVDISDVQPLFYPSDFELSQSGVKGIYLNNYIRWDPKAQHEEMLPLYGYNAFKFGRAMEHYDNVDCQIYNRLHDEIKYRKWGYFKAVDHVCRELRLGRLSREQGGVIAANSLSVEIEGVEKFCTWLGISSDELWSFVDAHRDPNVWKKDGNHWVWQVQNTPWTKSCADLSASEIELGFKTQQADYMCADPLDNRLLMQGDLQRKEWIEA